MPRADHDKARERLETELAEFGFSPEQVDEWLLRLCDGKITAWKVQLVVDLLVRVRSSFDARKQELEDSLKREKDLRQDFVDRIHEFVGESVQTLKKFAADATDANQSGFWFGPEVIQAMRELGPEVIQDAQ